MRGMSSSSSFILQAASNTLTNYYLILLLGSNLAGTVGRVFFSRRIHSYRSDLQRSERRLGGH